ncbi:family 10 glycosylhydrolase [Synechococcus elongatus]|nr:family 10 glycosylhydrolase [Synechococcus elongatus]WKW05335.1 family 10 glycosylhydrolase [Synechococcus elongatus PCC 7942 = FACHB-805]
MPASLRRWLSGIAAIACLPLQSPAVNAQIAPAPSTGYNCDLALYSVPQANLLARSLQGDTVADQQYRQLVRELAMELRNCRQQVWPRKMAIWVRLYSCDLRPGGLDSLFDGLQALGYNEVFIETFYDGRVLLPAADNPTVWPSVVAEPGLERVDLLAEAIRKGRERGMSVYAWLFTLNYGYSYSQRSDRQDTLARNGRSESSLEIVSGGAQVFVDPFNPVARQDYQTLLRSVLSRRPDGVLFDYVRYPRGTGAASVMTKVADLLIHTTAARQAWINQLNTPAGQALLTEYLDTGRLSPSDRNQLVLLLGDRLKELNLRQDVDPLWSLAVYHAWRGVVEFVDEAVGTVAQAGLPSGAVFFPFGNARVGQQGWDSRMQPWDRFPNSMEYHPMSYALCGDRHDCVMAEVQRVLEAKPNSIVQPAIAGTWGANFNAHLPLEQRMAALRSTFGDRIDRVSHFSLAWMDPQGERQRQRCRL